MSKQLQIGSDIFQYPENNENPGWGEEATAWAEAVTTALEASVGPNDILVTTATITNNQTTFSNIPGFNFNTAEVQHISAEFLIVREYDSGASVVTESGTITGNYDGSDFYIAIESVGDAGIEFNVTSAGQMQYKSSNLANHISSTISFKARTIDAP